MHASISDTYQLEHFAPPTEFLTHFPRIGAPFTYAHTCETDRFTNNGMCALVNVLLNNTSFIKMDRDGNIALIL
jgi:hypothetical protein